MKIQRYRGVEGYDDRTLHFGGYSEKKQTYRDIKLFFVSFLIICVSAALETTLLARIPLPLISSGRPSLCFVFTLASGYIFGKKEGGVCGIMAGIMAECAAMEPLPGGIMIYPLIFCILGYISGALSKIFLGENVFSFLIYVIMGCVAFGMFQMASTVISTGRFPAFAYFINGFLPSFIVTLPFAFPLYLLVLWGQRVLDK